MLSVCAVAGEEDSNKLSANEEIVAQLVSMGFNYVPCQKAAINTSNVGVEEAMTWLLSHMDDPGIGDPLSILCKTNLSRKVPFGQEMTLDLSFFFLFFSPLRRY